MTTTENNRADALIDERIEDAIYRHIPPKIALENAKALYAMAVELLVASPVEQFAPSPIENAEEMRDAAMRTVQDMGFVYAPGSERWHPNVNHIPAPSLAEERAASWYCCDPVQICSAQCDSCAKQARAALTAIVGERAECIAWANANGFTKYHESMCAAWEERARRAAQQLSVEIAELKIKLVSYELEREDQTRYLAAQSEEIADLKYQLADERAASFEAWCDRFPEISAVERLRDAWQESRATLPEDRIDWITNTHCPGGTAYPVNVKNAIREALREARISDNETGAEVAQQLSAEIAELKIKLVSYEREREDQIRYLAAQSEEIAGLKQQLAHADARVGLTATVIQKCIDSCAAEYLEDVTGHPEDAAYCQGITDCIDALNRLKTADWSAILAAHSGQSEPETATVACIERLRKALFESRDAMRVMSNWAKKPDPAGHSWAVRMLDRANAALNGEPEPRSELTVSRCFRCGHADHAGPCVNVHPDLAARAGDAENDYARFRSIAEDLKEGGNHVASEAIDELLTSAISAHDAKQEAARHAKRITELEAALEMVRGIRYQEMRLHLPEGGHVSLRWPESMSLESAEMLREVFDLQMKAHAKYMANRVTAPEADAARTGASS
ncbi:hypothetical protein [Burkholderia pseudomallei]|uniref:hypothetical protein n=1 Tax=Burkholderia pseudomallei TaxID=28450 RepID=UPI000F099E8D|nr:hypothetical protein [Burkholderia pseudomallei]VBR19247.1 gp43 [Burkholderia pseudomallei]